MYRRMFQRQWGPLRIERDQSRARSDKTCLRIVIITYSYAQFLLFLLYTVLCIQFLFSQCVSFPPVTNGLAI